MPATNKAKPTHCEMSQFETSGDQLVINHVPISQLCDRVGQTPFYAYDRSVIANNIHQLREQFNSLANLHYAIKANPMSALVDFISPLVDGLDVASGKELTVALNSGISPSKISFAGPGKQSQELLMAIAAGVTINVESAIELERIMRICDSSNYAANIALRVNPDFDLKASGMKMAGGAQQFGIDAEKIAQLTPQLQHEKINLKGLHIFTGSQNLKSEAIQAAHNNIFELAAKLSEQLNCSLDHLNIGGGFGIPYFPGETPLDLPPIADNLAKLRKAYQKQFSTTEIILELGRYLVGNAGVYITRVIDIKQSRGENFVIVDGGLHHHLSASGNFGQVIRKNYPVKIANKINQTQSQTATITGPLCTPLDLLAKNMQFPEIEIGDLVAVFQSGAYGFTASPRDFLSHPQPIEVLV